MNLLQAKQTLSRKLDIDYANIANNGLFADDDLTAYINDGQNLAWSMYTWEPQQVTKTITNTEATSYAYPTGILPKSATVLFVAGVQFPKYDYESYVNLLATDDAATTEMWSEFDGNIYINYYTSTDSLIVMGTETVATLSGSTDDLFFTDATGNDAVVELAYAEALSSAKLNNPNKAQYIGDGAKQKLAIVWRKQSQDKSRENSDKQMFRDFTLNL